MCLINVAHEHLITQTGKKSKQLLINFMRPGAEGQRAEGRHMGPRAEGREKQIPVYKKRFSELNSIKSPLFSKYFSTAKEI